MSMISSFCRPSNRPPSFEESPKPSKEVSFANSSAANNESPRSCTNMNIFVSTTESKVGANEEAATAADPACQDDMYTEETPAEVAMLLASVADIATKEIKADPPVMSELADAFPRFPDLSSTERVENTNYGNDDMMEYQVIPEEQQKQTPIDVPTLMHFDHNKHYTRGSRPRAFSMDCGPEFLRSVGEPLEAPPSSPPHEEEAIPTLLQWRNLRGEATTPPHHHSIFSTPPTSPLVTSSHNRRPRAYSTSGYHHTTHRTPKRSPHRVGRPRSISLAEGITAAATAASSSIEQVPVLDLTAPEHQVNENKPKKLILRKKFSWKNYPELEEFLIANREEYLRHSTLNYTQMQKKYNNCLTERMIKLAAEHGYMFDESEFSFVTVRDRIRCYYKSYVQSMKKRGVVIGYAARKAGLVSEEQLEESAHTSGKIYVPKN